MAIITKHLWRSRDIWLGPAALTLISGLLLLGGERWRLALRYDRSAIAAGQWWRLLSGNFVHLGLWHWIFNVLSLALLMALCPEALRSGAAWRRALTLAAGVGLGLYVLTPALPDYVGLSGMIYGLFVLGLAPQVRRGDRIALACLVFLIGRVAWEACIGAPASEEALLGGRVVAESHLWGMATALMYWLAAGAAAGWRERSTNQ